MSDRALAGETSVARTGKGFFSALAGHLRAFAVFSALTANTVVWCAPLFVLALFKLLLPVRAIRIVLTRWLMGIGENWVSGNAMILGLTGARHMDVRGGDNLNRHGWYLVIANHQTWVDIVVLQVLFNRRIPFLKFFIKQELIWFPFLGLAWWALDMPFMKRYSKSYLARHPEKKGQDFEATRAACEKFRNTPTSIINFIEGTRFSAEKKERRASTYENVLPPRASGIALTLSSMGTLFDKVLDVTIVYPRGVVNFWDLCRGNLDHVVIDIDQRPVEAWMTEGDYGHDRNFRSTFHRWLTAIWKEKDAKIGVLRSAHGTREPLHKAGRIA